MADVFIDQSLDRAIDLWCAHLYELNEVLLLAQEVE
jgi:hypothetical protein